MRAPVRRAPVGWSRRLTGPAPGRDLDDSAAVQEEEGAHVRADLRGADRSRLGGVDATRAVPAVVGAREDHDPRVRDRPARRRQDLHRDGSGRGHGQVTGHALPLEGTFTHIEPQRSLVYDARSWTEAKVDRTRRSTDRQGAKMAAFGMKCGYKAQLDNLEALLAG